jgi:hypothetical protein
MERKKYPSSTGFRSLERFQLSSSDASTLIFKIICSLSSSISVMILLLPNAQTYIIARFCNRQDAHDHLQILNRFMPAAEFKLPRPAYAEVGDFSSPKT